VFLPVSVVMGLLTAAAMSVTGFLPGLIVAHRSCARDRPFRVMADATGWLQPAIDERQTA